MEKQIFHPSWILRPVIFLFSCYMFVLLTTEMLSEEMLFLKILAFMASLLFGGWGIFVSLFCFPTVIVTSQYIKIGSREPIEWKKIKKIKYSPSRYIETILIIKRTEDKALVILTFMSKPKKLLQAIEQYFYITQPNNHSHCKSK